MKLHMKPIAVALGCILTTPALATNINLTGYKLTFDDEFNKLSVSQSGTTTTWADIRQSSRFDANSDIGFGASSFLDAASGYNPFSVSGGALTITGIPYTVKFGYPGSWQSGLIHTAGTFVQTYGYFEMRAKFNSVPGTWPAFWLLPATPLHPAGRDPSLWQELDVVEQYGAYTQGVYSNIHTTEPAPAGVMWNFFSSHPEIASGYHTYGMDWEPKTITFYVDGVLMGSKPTPDDMTGPMYMLVDLARDTPYKANAAAMSMNVDYVRAFSNSASAIAVRQDTVSAPDSKDPGLYGATAANSLPPDKLSLVVYEDAYKGDCQFTVSVDGVPIGGVLTTTGTKKAPQTIVLPASLPRGNHAISVDFLNDLYAGTASNDRNLYVQSIAVDGVQRYGSAALYSTGSQTYKVIIP